MHGSVPFSIVPDFNLVWAVFLATPTPAKAQFRW